MKIITYVEPNGDRKAAIVEISRTLAKMSPKKPPLIIDNLDPRLRNEIETFLKWIKAPKGLSSYIKYYLEQNNTQIISELSKIYKELTEIIST